MGTFARAKFDIENFNEAVETAITKAGEKLPEIQETTSQQLKPLRSKTYDFNTVFVVAVISFAIGFALTKE